MKKQAQKMVYTGSGFARGALRYLRATGGTTAMMFAVSLPAVMGAVGLASDFAIYSMKLPGRRNSHFRLPPQNQSMMQQQALSKHLMMLAQPFP
jgi:hypothetical protein